MLLERKEIELETLSKMLSVDKKVLVEYLKKIGGVVIFDEKIIVNSKLDVIQSGLLLGVPPNILFRYVDWKEFEKKVSDIIEKHGFSVIYNFVGLDRFRKKRFQVDIIGIKVPDILVIDTKHWSYKTTVKSRIQIEIQKHYERAKLLAENTKFSTMLFNYLTSKKTRVMRFYPVIVTLSPKYKWIDEKGFIVPLNYLNDFIIHFHQIREEIAPIVKEMRV